MTQNAFASRRRRAGRTVSLITVCLALAGIPSSVRGQSATEGNRPWWALWTKPSDQNRLLWGMWTVHLDDLDDGWSNDGTVAVVYRGYYAGTFQTTHGPRGWTAGFERLWLSGDWKWVGAMVGFRTGLVYGYDRRLGWMAEKYPILPFAQPVVYARLGPLTADFTYTWVVASLTAGVRF